MKTLLIYLVQVMVISGLLYGYYHFFLRNKKFHQYNRYYLLLATVLSLVLPLFRIPVYYSHTPVPPAVFRTLTVLDGNGFEASAPEIIPTSSYSNWFTMDHVLLALYVALGLLLLYRLMRSLARIDGLRRRFPQERLDDIRLITTNDPATPFSFFRWLFWNQQISFESAEGQQMLRHELYHIRQRHSWDILLLETIRAVTWINPFFYLIKKEMQAIHEFLADSHAVEKNQEWRYAELLLMQLLGTPQLRLATPFFNAQIKRRIMMLTTSSQPGFRYLRKIMVLPILTLTIFLFAFSYRHNIKTDPLVPVANPTTMLVVLDPGHGGIDPGVISPDHRYSEAALSLQLAQEIKLLAGEYNIQIVLTRETDELPGQAINKDEGLRNRLKITNQQKPAAFISLHLDNGSLKATRVATGFQAYIASQRTDNAGKILATTVLDNLRTLYPAATELIQEKNKGIFVLDKNSYPSVLLECGYIDNSRDLAFITDQNNQEKIARAILKSLVAFEKNKDSRAQESPSASSGNTGNHQSIASLRSAVPLNQENNEARASFVSLRDTIIPLQPVTKQLSLTNTMAANPVTKTLVLRDSQRMIFKVHPHLQLTNPSNAAITAREVALFRRTLNLSYRQEFRQTFKLKTARPNPGPRPTPTRLLLKKTELKNTRKSVLEV